MRLLDLFCGAGGAAKGYHRAGFTEITGIDIVPQPRYPYTFIQSDALEYLVEHGHEYDMIHASPPCQAYSAMTKGRWQDRLAGHPNLIGATRELLLESGVRYVIENVPGAGSELINPIMLCGTMFNLETKGGSQLRRHRLFECPGPFALTPPCNHKSGSVIGVYGGGQHPNRRNGKGTFGVADRRDAMGIQWMTGKELSQAIPPAYTEWIAHKLTPSLFNPTDTP